MPGRVLEMGSLTYPEFLALDRDKTVVLLAVSPTEIHGPHLPLCTDWFLATEAARKAASQVLARLPDYDALIAPTIALGSDVIPLPGSIGIRPRVLQGLVADVGSALARAGFRYIAVLSGHGGPRHNAAIELACREVNRKHRGAQMFSPTAELIHYILLGSFQEDLQDRCQGLLPEEDVRRLWPSDVHAGALETSLGLLFMPDQVRPGYQVLPPVVFGEKKGAKASAARLLFRMAGRLVALFSGKDAGFMRLFFDNLCESALLWAGPQKSEMPLYAGYPGLASESLGNAYTEMIAERGAATVEEVVAGRKTAADTFTPLSRSFLMRMSMYL
ncbi:MAG: creatininase family protein [Thermodesulfobacteriota bacterium]